MKKILWIIILLVSYVIFINIVSLAVISYYNNFSGNDLNSEGNLSSDLKIGVNEKIDVQISRPRFYGTILENVGENPYKELLVLNTFSLPLKYKDLNYNYVHAVFIICLVIFYFKFKEKQTQKEVNNELKNY